MATQFELRATPNGLVVKSKMPQARLRALISGCVSASVVALVAYRFVRAPIVIVVSVLGGIFGYMEIIRQRTVRLSATNLEFQTITGDFYRSRTAIPRANIEALEYREERGGPEHSEPAGLYAELRAGSKCILPYLDERQTQAVIEAIYKRFPDMPIAGRDAKSSFDKHFTTLGI
jgi:hypothetical protein